MRGHSMWAVCWRTIKRVWAIHFEGARALINESKEHVLAVSKHLISSDLLNLTCSAPTLEDPVIFIFLLAYTYQQNLTHTFSASSHPSLLSSDTIDLFSSLPAKLRLSVGRFLGRLIRHIRVLNPSICYVIFKFGWNMQQQQKLNNLPENSSLKHGLLD